MNQICDQFKQNKNALHLIVIDILHNSKTKKYIKRYIIQQLYSQHNFHRSQNLVDRCCFQLMKPNNLCTMNLQTEINLAKNNPLAVINEEESDNESMSHSLTRIENKLKFNNTFLCEEKIKPNLNGLDKFMNFLGKKQTAKPISLQALPSKTKTQENDGQNPQIKPIARPKSSCTQEKKGLDKFINFLQTQDKIALQKINKKSEKNTSLNKFMETLDKTQTIKQEKKLSNIVSGILGLSDNLPQKNNSIKHRYLINESKFEQIKAKKNQTKLGKRNHSASLLSNPNSKVREPKEKLIKIMSLKLFTTKIQQTDTQMKMKVNRRKIKFIENIASESSLLKVKILQKQKNRRPIG